VRAGITVALAESCRPLSGGMSSKRSERLAGGHIFLQEGADRFQAIKILSRTHFMPKAAPPRLRVGAAGLLKEASDMLVAISCCIHMQLGRGLFNGI